jgi:phosphomannomutase
MTPILSAKISSPSSSTTPQRSPRGVRTDYWKTGHSYIKRRVNELSALAGFEKSGHFFFTSTTKVAFG